MSGWHFNNLLTAVIIATTAAAWWKGGWPERIGASLNLAITLAVVVLQATVRHEGLGPWLLGADAALGVGFLILAVRYASLWLGVAMLLQAGQFSLHAFYDVTARPIDRLFIVVNNVVSWSVLLCILAGVAASWIQSARAARTQDLD